MYQFQVNVMSFVRSAKPANLCREIFNECFFSTTGTPQRHHPHTHSCSSWSYALQPFVALEKYSGKFRSQKKSKMGHQKIIILIFSTETSPVLSEHLFFNQGCPTFKTSRTEKKNLCLNTAYNFVFSRTYLGEYWNWHRKLPAGVAGEIEIFFFIYEARKSRDELQSLSRGSAFSKEN